MSELERERINWAKRTLGPIFFDLLDRFHQVIVGRCLQQQTVALFCTRSGVRLKLLYDLYLNKVAATPAAGRIDLFAVSRMLAAKACFVSCPSEALDALASEYANYRFGAAVCRWLPQAVRNSLHDMDRVREEFRDLWEMPVERWMLNRIVEDDGHFSRLIRAHFETDGCLYRQYVLSRVENDHPVLIDTGWQATQQRLLMLAFPEIDWFGAYFGRMISADADSRHLRDVIGLFFETHGYDPSNRKSVVYFYHHLIEDCLEPDLSSFVDPVECPGLHMMNVRDIAAPTVCGDEHFRGIVAYFEEVVENVGRIDIRAASEKAFSNLCEMILYPTRELVAIAATRVRSQDFGKDENKLAVIIPDRAEWLRREERLRCALWKAGQIALEFDDNICRKEQDRWLAVADPLYPSLPDTFY